PLSASPHEITQLLTEWANGDKSALDRLMPVVYRELHKLAKRYMGEQVPGSTLQVTAVIHEAYMKLAGYAPKRCENRDHFLAVAAKAMRQVLVDHARAGQAYKRGGSGPVVQLDDDV